MNRSFNWKNLILSACAAVLAASVGCESGGNSKVDAGYWGDGTSTAPREERPPPAAEKPAPAPARSNWWPTMSDDASWDWSAMAYPTGEAATSVVGVEKGYPREVRLNQAFDYRIVVTNLTKNTLDNVGLTDVLGANLKYNSSNPNGAFSANTLNWALGSFKPQESKTVTVNVTPTAEGSVGSCASVTYASTLCSTVPVVSPKLKITKTGPAEVLKCDEIVYNIEVSNTGTGAISGVKVTDNLPNGLKTADGKTSVEFAVGTLTAGQSKQLTVRAKADAKGKYDNKATASADGGMNAETAVVSTMVRQPALKITKTGPKDSFTTVPFSYDITVTNSGDAPAANTVIEDSVPAGTVFVSATDGGANAAGKVTWNVGTLAPGASKKVSMTVRGDSPTVVKNTATAKATCADAVSATAETAIKGIPAILLEVVDLTDPNKVGDNVTYKITVTNQGSAVDTNIKITCSLEENQTFVSAGGATSGTGAGNTVTFQPLGSLAPKAVAEWTVTVKNVKAGDVRFKVSMKSDNLTRNVEETEATNVYQ